MNLFVDTSVWSLALRRDAPASAPEVARLAHALGEAQPIFTTGLVLQELLQGFRGPRAADAILARFAVLPFVTPDRRDHVEAAGLRNEGRRRGVQISTIDALLAQLCIQRGLTLLSTDRGFDHIAAFTPLDLWRAGRRPRS